MRSVTWTLHPISGPSAFAADAPVGSGVHAAGALAGSPMADLLWAGKNVPPDWFDNGSFAIKPPSTAAINGILHPPPFPSAPPMTMRSGACERVRVGDWLLPNG